MAGTLGSPGHCQKQGLGAERSRFGLSSAAGLGSSVAVGDPGPASSWTEGETELGRHCQVHTSRGLGPQLLEQSVVFDGHPMLPSHPRPAEVTMTQRTKAGTQKTRSGMPTDPGLGDISMHLSHSLKDLLERVTQRVPHSLSSQFLHLNSAQEHGQPGSLCASPGQKDTAQHGAQLSQPAGLHTDICAVSLGRASLCCLSSLDAVMKTEWPPRLHCNVCGESELSPPAQPASKVVRCVMAREYLTSEDTEAQKGIESSLPGQVSGKVKIEHLGSRTLHSPNSNVSSLLRGNERSPRVTSSSFLLSVVLSVSVSFKSPSPQVWVGLLHYQALPSGWALCCMLSQSDSLGACL